MSQHVVPKIIPAAEFMKGKGVDDLVGHRALVHFSDTGVHECVVVEVNLPEFKVFLRDRRSLVTVDSEEQILGFLGKLKWE